MQIIPRGQSFWGELGTGLGELAGLKLAGLVKQHGQKKEREEFAQTWAPYLGKEKAHFLSNLAPEERKNVLSNLEPLMQLQQLQQQPRQQNVLSSLQGQPSSQTQSQMAPMQQQNPRQELQEALGQYFNNPTLGGIPQQQQQFSYQPQEYVQEQSQAPEVNQQQFAQNQISPDNTQLVADLFATPQERQARKKAELDKRKIDLQERRETIAATKDYVNGLKEKEKAVKEANLRLGRMEKLIEKGNLPNAAIWSALSKLENAPYISGLTAPFAEVLKGGVKWYSGNPSDIEEFEKLSSEFVKNAKQYFGSRITQKEVEMFMQTVPTLMQTDAGKKKLISNIRSLNELTEIEAKEARSIIKDNNGVPPIDIEQQVQDKIGNKLDKVAKKFIVRA